MNELLQQLREARLRASADRMGKAKAHIEEALELLDDALTQRPGPQPSARVDTTGHPYARAREMSTARAQACFLACYQECGRVLMASRWAKVDRSEHYRWLHEEPSEVLLSGDFVHALSIFTLSYDVSLVPLPED